MAINVHRHADLAMPQQFLNHLGMNAHAQQYRSNARSQIVKTDRGQFRLFQERLEAIHDFRWIERRSQRRTKNEIALLPLWTGLEFCLSLASAMLLEQTHRKRCKQNAPPALFGFGLRFNIPVTQAASEDTPDLKQILRCCSRKAIFSCSCASFLVFP